MIEDGNDVGDHQDAACARDGQHFGAVGGQRHRQAKHDRRDEYVQQHVPEVVRLGIQPRLHRHATANRSDSASATALRRHLGAAHKLVLNSPPQASSQTVERQKSLRKCIDGLDHGAPCDADRRRAGKREQEGKHLLCETRNLAEPRVQHLPERPVQRRHGERDVHCRAWQQQQRQGKSGQQHLIPATPCKRHMPSPPSVAQQVLRWAWRQARLLCPYNWRIQAASCPAEPTSDGKVEEGLDADRPERIDKDVAVGVGAKPGRAEEANQDVDQVGAPCSWRNRSEQTHVALPLPK